MSTAMTVSLIDVSTYLPGEPVPADYYAQFAESDELRDNVMFRAPRYRHHVAEDETAIDMVERAAAGVVDRHGHDALADVDVLITHTQMPDMPFYGGGGAMSHRLGMKPSWVIDLHNGGCAAFVLGLKMAGQSARQWAGSLRVDRGGTKRRGADLRPTHSAPEGPSGGARRRSRGGPRHCVG